VKGTSDWWDYSWNVTGGCRPVSPGCRFCYAPRQAATVLQKARAARAVVPLYDGVAVQVNCRYVFTCKFTVLPPGHPVWTFPWRSLGARSPLLGKGMPYLIFVGDMSDIFWEKVPDSVIDRVVATLAASDHVGLLLTKRARRMAEYFAAQRSPERLRQWQAHLWLGFSAERQREFDQRWADMRELAARGWTVFVSIAPMLGPVVVAARLPGPRRARVGDRVGRAGAARGVP
jgi:protein gp37